MSFIRNQAAVLLALLPALPTGSHDASDEHADDEKSDVAGSAGPMGRQGVLELLETGVISTEEALDLLDGIDQTSLAAGEPVGPGYVPGGWSRRPPRPPRPARPARPARPGRSAARGSGRDEDERGHDDDQRGWAEGQDNRAYGPAPGAFPGRRTLRVQVDSADGSDVNLALPIGFLETGLKVAERFSPGLLGGDVGNSIRRAVGSGQSGTIIEVNDADGSHVRIAIE